MNRPPVGTLLFLSLSTTLLLAGASAESTGEAPPPSLEAKLGDYFAADGNARENSPEFWGALDVLSKDQVEPAREAILSWCRDSPDRTQTSVWQYQT